MIQILNFPLYVWICLAFLILLSIIDLKTYRFTNGKIPSFLTMLFIILIFISVGYPQNIYMGIFALIIALALSDLGMYYGHADLKIIIAVGMTFNYVFNFLIFAGILSIVSLTFKVILKKIYKQKEIPFIPIILFTYILCMIIGYIIRTFI